MIFRDRKQAGQLLAGRLLNFGGRADVIVLGLPRGGVPVAYEVALELRAPLDVMVVRKLGVPGREELAFGAIAFGGVRVLNHFVVAEFQISPGSIDAIAARESAELQRRERLYRGDRPYPVIQDRIVILVDDGLATGSTMRAAVKAVNHYRPAKTIVAVPVSPLETCRELADLADEVVCLETPEPFYSVGSWYENFDQTSDSEVRQLLNG